MVNYMANPSQVLFEYLQQLPGKDPGGSWKRWWEYGQLAISLEMVTLIKNLEELPVATDIGRQETISALHTLLQQMGLDVLAWTMYDQLCEWRRPKFVADAHELPELEPRENVAADAHELQDLPDDSASLLAETEGRAARYDMTRASEEIRRGLDASPNGGRLEQTGEVLRETLTDEPK